MGILKHILETKYFTEKIISRSLHNIENNSELHFYYINGNIWLNKVRDIEVIVQPGLWPHWLFNRVLSNPVHHSCFLLTITCSSPVTDVLDLPLYTLYSCWTLVEWSSLSQFHQFNTAI